ncbi:MAG: putative metal-binding motif-containing protein [archaeon]
MKQPQIVIMLAIFLIFTINSASAITASTCSYKLDVKYLTVPSQVTRSICVNNKNTIPVKVLFAASPLAISNILYFHENDITLQPGEKRFVNFTSTISQQLNYDGTIKSTFYVNPNDPACQGNPTCNFPIAYQISQLSISKGSECSNGQVRSCTLDNCDGDQVCSGGSWGACVKFDAQCGLCQEDWTCTDWGACIAGQQIRSCSDQNACGTEYEKPDEAASCTECTQNLDCQNLDCNNLNGCYAGKQNTCGVLPGTCTNGVCEHLVCPSGASCPHTGTDADNDGFDLQCQDCNDNNNNIYPGKAEICNNLDDNCNGAVDDLLVRGCDMYHEGLCAIGTETCNAGNWAGCPAPSVELCDLKDNDCDGFVDKDLTRQCGTTDTGICEYGQEVCQTGLWKNCNAIFPQQEIPLNGIDENCDGTDSQLCTLYTPNDLVYTSRKIPFNIICDRQVAEIKYSMDNSRFIRSCTNCNSNYRNLYFSEGHNNFFVQVVHNGQTYNFGASFFVDSRVPYISGTNPRSGYSNGWFSIDYTEENVKNITLFVRGIGGQFFSVSKDDCPSGSRQTCSIFSDVSAFDGDEIEYYFTVEDIAGGNTDSRLTRLRVDMTSPIMTILTPFENIYSTNSVLFDINITEPVILSYLDKSDASPRDRQLCSSCNLYSRTVTFSDGFHNITITAADSAGNTDTYNVTFYVDKTAPRIRSTSPTSGYTNGDFTVIYTEDTPVMVKLFYRQVGAPVFLGLPRTDCPAGRDQTCDFHADISSYDGNSIEYYFRIEDISGNSAESRLYSLSVDISAPVLTVALFDQVYSNTRLPFNLSSTETADLVYIDQYDSTPREKRLCSSCTKYERIVSLVNGFHNITFIARDRAGNTDTKHAEFFVDSAPPKISSITPRGGFATGAFEVEYTEENCQEMIFKIVGPLSTITKSMPCVSGTRVRATCGTGGAVGASGFVDISQFENQTVSYTFIVIDIANNSQSKTVSNLLVDTVPPTFSTFSAVQEGRYLIFNITLGETVKYLKYTDPSFGGQERSLCGNCNSYGTSSLANKYFSPGAHNVTVIAEDAAGNRRYSENIIFTTV